MRISDWSSDVCSSDLLFAHQLKFRLRQREAFDVIPALAERIGQEDFRRYLLQDRMADRGPQRVCRRLRCKDEERVALAVCLEAILRKCCERRIGQRLPKFVNRNHHALACQERSEEHTSEIQSLMRISYAVFCLKKKKKKKKTNKENIQRTQPLHTTHIRTAYV